MAGNSIPYDGVVAAVPITIPYQRYSDRHASYFAGRALLALLRGAGLDKQDIDGLAISSYTLSPDSVASLCEHFDLTVRWIEQVPLGGASGIVAMRRAARAIQAGDAEVIACIGADTHRRGTFTDLVSQFSEFSNEAAYPYGAAGPNALFGLITDAYMFRFGASRQSFGHLCIAQRENARSFPHALLKDPLTMTDYLAARPIAEPLHLFDCVMPCAGAEAFLVMSQEKARALAVDHVRILALEELHHAFSLDPIQLRGGWELFRKRLYDAAGVSPYDIGLVETYDDYPVMSVIQIEDLGFCDKGDGWRWLAQRQLTCAGDFPHNSSGGQLSCGQAGAAGGFLGLVEAIRQLTGAALGNQCLNVVHALVSGYGMVNYDRGLCSAAVIISRADS